MHQIALRSGRPRGLNILHRSNAAPSQASWTEQNRRSTKKLLRKIEMSDWHFLLDFIIMWYGSFEPLDVQPNFINSALFRTSSSVMIKLFLKLNLGDAWGGEVLGANSIAWKSRYSWGWLAVAICAGNVLVLAPILSPKVPILTTLRWCLSIQVPAGGKVCVLSWISINFLRSEMV
jgi:hypothetical protein